MNIADKYNWSQMYSQRRQLEQSRQKDHRWNKNDTVNSHMIDVLHWL